MEKIFLPLYNYFEKHRALFFGCLLTSFLAVGYFAFQVTLEEDIAAILPKDEKTEKLNQVFRNSRFMDKLVLHVSSTDSSAVPEPDSLVAFTETLVSTIQAQLQPYIKKINDKVDDELVLQLFNDVQQRLPLYLEEKDYATIDSLIAPSAVKNNLAQNIRTLSSPAGIAVKKMIGADPVGISFIGLKKLQQLQYDERFELYDNYIVTKDKRHLLLFVTPAYPANNTGKNAALLKGLDRIIDSLTTQAYKNTTASYFGATAVSVGNAQQLRRDNLLTQGVTVLFLLVFIAWYFRKKRSPFLMLLPVVFGALFALAGIYFIKGSISVIALGSGSVVLGIAINYSLHVFNHYRHTGDIRTVIRELSMPMTIGGITTIGSFLCLQWVQSPLLQDLGLFAALSLIGASLCSLIFLPHLIVTKKPVSQPAVLQYTWIDKLAAYQPESNKWILIAIVLLTVVFGYFSRHVGFETDMMRMNYMSDPLRKAEMELNRINDAALQSVYLISTGRNLDEALVKNEQVVATLQTLERKGSVKTYSGVSTVLFSDSLQKARIARWNNYWTAEKKHQLLTTLQREGTAAGYRNSAFEGFISLLNQSYAPVDNKAMAEIRKTFLEDFIIETPGQTMIVTLVKPAAGHKQDLYASFDNKPGITAIDKQYLTNKLVNLVQMDFNSIAIMSSLLVFFVLLLSYGRLELALITFIPMLVTWVWILGIMGILGIQFNLINIIISTLIFGLGDDYSIFIMDGLLQEYKTGKKLLGSYKSSIFISAITTIAGLGVLIFAKHPALRSIALIAIIGIVCVVVIAQVLIPFLFRILIVNRTRNGKFPLTFTGLFKSLFAFSYFITGCNLLTVVGLLLIDLNPFNKAKGRLIYHSILAKFGWSLMYIMGNVKKRIHNPLNERFEKPAVIIANHQSSLDILAMIMLHPKLVLFTNNWVWNSPVFGFLVKMAGYYPVAEGAENSLEKIKARVSDGYSVVIFPEGTRSPDGNMKRFHKGAFYLAEQLQLDILPIVLHGTGYTMSKNDFLLKDGTITLQFLPRITPGDNQWGEGYAARAKKIGSYFRDAYQQLRRQQETPNYFREQLIYNYLYKGPILEWYMRVKLQLEKNYTVFNQLVPQQGKILDIGCGYGFLSYMLYFTASGRDITGLDYDEEKIETANHCFSRTAHIRFVYANVLQFHFENYDAIILSDVLHYLQANEQQQVIEKCLRHLNAGGTLIIRDGNKELEERHKGTRLTEYFSTRLFKFNKTSGQGLTFLSGSSIHAIAAAQGVACTELDDTKFTSNIIYVIKKPSPHTANVTI